MNTDFSVSQDHLKPIGYTEIIVSDTYGSYIIRCVANLNMVPLNISVDDQFRIMSKAHPKHWYCSYKMYTDETARDSRYVSILVPLLDDNIDWYKTNPTSTFAVHLKTTKSRNKKLPVAISLKSLDKYIEKLQPFILE